jgi:hypothetical protein
MCVLAKWNSQSSPIEFQDLLITFSSAFVNITSADGLIDVRLATFPKTAFYSTVQRYTLELDSRNRICVRDWHSGGELVFQSPSQQSELTTAAFSCSDSLIAVGAKNGRVYLWDAFTGERIFVFEAKPVTCKEALIENVRGCHAIAFSVRHNKAKGTLCEWLIERGAIWPEAHQALAEFAAIELLGTVEPVDHFLLSLESFIEEWKGRLPQRALMLKLEDGLVIAKTLYAKIEKILRCLDADLRPNLQETWQRQDVGNEQIAPTAPGELINESEHLHATFREDDALMNSLWQIREALSDYPLFHDLVRSNILLRRGLPALPTRRKQIVAMIDEFKRIELEMRSAVNSLRAFVKELYDLMEQRLADLLNPTPRSEVKGVIKGAR